MRKHLEGTEVDDDDALLWLWLWLLGPSSSLCDDVDDGDVQITHMQRDARAAREREKASEWRAHTSADRCAEPAPSRTRYDRRGPRRAAVVVVSCRSDVSRGARARESRRRAHTGWVYWSTLIYQHRRRRRCVLYIWGCGSTECGCSTGAILEVL